MNRSAHWHFPSHGTTAGVTAWLVVAFVVPQLVSNYSIFQLTMLMSYMLALLGSVVLTGYCGQISIGQGAFYGFGAYSAAIAISKFGLHYSLAIPLAGLTSLILGATFGLPALRLKGVYLALATFALAVAFPSLLKHRSAESLTGGVLGIELKLPGPPSWVPADRAHWYFLIAFVTLTVFVLAARNLLKSRIGRAFISIRDNPIAAMAMGVNISRFKLISFSISSMLTGTAGALSAIVVQYVAPDSFAVYLSILLLVGAVIGGLHSLSGIFFGAVFVLYVPNLAEQVSKAAPSMVYGLALIFVVLFAPEGIPALIGTLVHRVKRICARRSSDIQPGVPRVRTP